MLLKILVVIVLLAGGSSFYVCDKRDPFSLFKAWCGWTGLFIIITFLVLWLIAIGKWVLASLGLY